MGFKITSGGLRTQPSTKFSITSGGLRTEIEEPEVPLMRPAPDPVRPSVPKLMGQQIKEHPFKTVFEAGARYPKALFGKLERAQKGDLVQEPYLKGVFDPNQDPRSATQISQDIGARVLPKPTIEDPSNRMEYYATVAKEFAKFAPFTTGGKLAEFRLDPAITTTFQGLGKILSTPQVAKFMGKPFQGPVWFEKIIKGTVKGFYQPFQKTAKETHEVYVNRVTDKIYKEFEKQMPEIKKAYHATFGTDPTPNDIKGLIKSKLIKEGVYDKPVQELKGALTNLRKKGMKFGGEQAAPPPGPPQPKMVGYQLPPERAAAQAMGMPKPPTTNILPERIPMKPGAVLGPKAPMEIQQQVGEEPIFQPPDLEKALWDKMTPEQQQTYIEGQKVALHPKPAPEPAITIPKRTIEVPPEVEPTTPLAKKLKAQMKERVTKEEEVPLHPPEEGKVAADKLGKPQGGEIAPTPKAEKYKTIGDTGQLQTESADKLVGDVSDETGIPLGGKYLTIRPSKRVPQIFTQDEANKIQESIRTRGFDSIIGTNDKGNIVAITIKREKVQPTPKVEGKVKTLAGMNEVDRYSIQNRMIDFAEMNWTPNQIAENVKEKLLKEEVFAFLTERGYMEPQPTPKVETPKLKAPTPPKLAAPQPIPPGKFVYDKKAPKLVGRQVTAPAFEMAPVEKAPPPKPKVTLPKGVSKKVIPTGSGDVITSKTSTDYKKAVKMWADMPFALLGNKGESISRMEDALKEMVRRDVENVYDLWGGSKGYRVGLFPDLKAENYHLNELSDERANFYKNMQDTSKAQIVKKTVNDLIDGLRGVMAKATGIGLEGRSTVEFLDSVNAWLKRAEGKQRYEKVRLAIQEYGSKILNEALADDFASPESSGKYYFLENAKLGVSSIVDDKGNYKWAQGILKSGAAKDVSRRLDDINRQLGQELLRDSGMSLTQANAWDEMDTIAKSVQAGKIDPKTTVVMADPQYLNSATYSVGNEDAFWEGHKKNLEKHFLPLAKSGVKIIYTNDADPKLMKWMQDNNLPYNIQEGIGAVAGRSGRNELIAYINFDFPREEYRPISGPRAERQVGQPKPRGEEPRGAGQAPQPTVKGEVGKPVREKVVIPTYAKDIEQKIWAKTKKLNISINRLKFLRKTYAYMDGEQFLKMMEGIVPGKPGQGPTFSGKKALVEKGFFQKGKFRTPTIARFLTPQDYYAIKLAPPLEKSLTMLMSGKLEMDIYSRKMIDEVESKVFEVDKVFKTTLAQKLKSGILKKPTKGIEYMRDLLNEYEEPPDFLSGEEKELFMWFRKLNREVIRQTNEVLVKQGMEPIKYRKAYVKHLATEMARDMLDGKYPFPKELEYWMKEVIGKKVFNPSMFKRLAGDLEDLFTKDLGQATKSMLYYSSKQIFLTQPLEYFTSEMTAYRKDMPRATRKWLEAFVNEAIKGQVPESTDAFNKIIKDSGVQGIMNKFLKPFGRTMGRNPVAKIGNFLGKITIYSVMPGKPRLPIRNKFQILQNLALYPLDANIKAFFPAPKSLKDKIDQSVFYRAYTGLEELNSSLKRELKKLGYSPERIVKILLDVGLAPYQWSAISNVTHSMKVAYYAASKLAKNPVYAKAGWTPQAVTKEMEWGANITQYLYVPLGMPQVFRYKELTGLTRLQSWWMNHFFKFSREAITRLITGKTLHSGGLPIPVGWRASYLRYLMIGGAILTKLGYKRSFLLGVLPGYLSPQAQLALGAYNYLLGWNSDNERQKKWGLNKMRYSVTAFVPYSGAWRDWTQSFKGEKSWKSLFMYTDEKKGKLKGF